MLLGYQERNWKILRDDESSTTSLKGYCNKPVVEVEQREAVFHRKIGEVQMPYRRHDGFIPSSSKGDGQAQQQAAVVPGQETK